MEFILEIDRYLTREMNIVMVGGTALTLLGKKESTKDIDICFKSEKDLEQFVKIAVRLGYSKQQNKLVGHGLLIDVYSGGYIFCVQLPNDYIEKAIEIKKMDKIHLFSLSPEDIIITKSARLNKRDLEDIKTIFESFEINKEKLVSRYISVMEESLVKDAKSNFLIIVETFNFPNTLKEKIKRWKND
jgi:predicted nucleotidyltransferase